MEWLVAHRRHRIAREASLLIAGLDVPSEVVIGPGLILQHRGSGTVIHPETTIGGRVTIYHQVTIGRRDAHVPREDSPMVRIEIGDESILYPGCRVLGGPGVTKIGRGTIVAANAVITQSTGDWEIWGGAPARRIGARPRNAARPIVEG
jgi:serine O-acetyltransferase